jgi:hypothetical protein
LVRVRPRVAGQGTERPRFTKRTTLESPFALLPDIAGEGERVFATQLEFLEKYNRAMEAVARDYDIRTAARSGQWQDADGREAGRRWDLSYIGPYRRIVGAIGESLGYPLMAKRVAANVASAWGLKRKQPTTRGLESCR